MYGFILTKDSYSWIQCWVCYILIVVVVICNVILSPILISYSNYPTDSIWLFVWFIMIDDRCPFRSFILSSHKIKKPSKQKSNQNYKTKKQLKQQNQNTKQQQQQQKETKQNMQFISNIIVVLLAVSISTVTAAQESSNFRVVDASFKKRKNFLIHIHHHLDYHLLSWMMLYMFHFLVMNDCYLMV